MQYSPPREGRTCLCGGGFGKKGNTIIVYRNHPGLRPPLPWRGIPKYLTACKICSILVKKSNMEKILWLPNDFRNSKEIPTKFLLALQSAGWILIGTTLPPEQSFQYRKECWLKFNTRGEPVECLLTKSSQIIIFPEAELSEIGHWKVWSHIFRPNFGQTLETIDPTWFQSEEA